MKILVTGGAGLLGHYVVAALLEAGYEVYATYHTRRGALEGARWVFLDLLDAGRVREVVEEVKPEVVIHAAAYTDVDSCEVDRDLAYRVNFLATAVLAKAASRLNSYFVYISTDYVFDGERGLYREEDAPRPVNYYGLSKLLGEAAVIASGENWAVVRVSGLYGVSPTGKKNFGVVALERLRKGEEVYAFYDQYLSPTYAYFLAYELKKFVERGLVGIFHVAGERASRYEFALTLAEALGASRELVKPMSMGEANLKAKRPRDSSLDVSKARGVGVALPPLREAVRHFVSTAV